MTLRSLRSVMMLTVFFAALTSIAQDAPHEFRVINGREVDITPVAEWFSAPRDSRSRTNTRPMPHWKAIQVQSIKGQVAGWDLCEVLNEKGQKVEVLMANLPATVRQPLTELAKIDAQIAACVKHAQMTQANKVNTLGGTSGRMAKARAAADAQSLNAVWNAEELRSMRSALLSSVATARETRVFAMASGRQYMQKEVWDCGIVKYKKL
jgi:hypothetical protein